MISLAHFNVQHDYWKYRKLKLIRVAYEISILEKNILQKRFV